MIFELCNQISSQKREKICETVLACSYGAQVKSFKQKIVKKTCDTVPLRYASPTCFTVKARHYTLNRALGCAVVVLGWSECELQQGHQPTTETALSAFRKRRAPVLQFSMTDSDPSSCIN